MACFFARMVFADLGCIDQLNERNTHAEKYE
jgi:hypothetical protein